MLRGKRRQSLAGHRSFSKGHEAGKFFISGRALYLGGCHRRVCCYCVAIRLPRSFNLSIISILSRNAHSAGTNSYKSRSKNQILRYIEDEPLQGLTTLPCDPLDTRR